MVFSPISGPAREICALVDATQRQLDYWARNGLFGDEPEWNAGSGSKRPWHLPVVVEVAWACARLADLGIDVAPLRQVADVIRARPVDPNGELLVVLADGPLRSSNRIYATPRVLRLSHWCARPGELDRVAAVVPLRSFAAVTPAGDSSDLPTGASPAGAEDGRHRTAPVPANHS